MADATIIDEEWGPFKKIAFRFTFVYILLYCLPFLFEFDFYKKGAEWLVGWVSRNVFGLWWVARKQTGSGDTLYHYLRLACVAGLTPLLVLAWTLLARPGGNYTRLFDLLRSYVRYYLALIMLSYGVAKIIPVQFSVPRLERLVQPLGEFSPMGLAWTFMGFSPTFEAFTGIAEATGAFLLLFRHTTTLGALILSAVLSNILMMNLCFDIPVKIGSAHYLAFTLFLLLPEIWRLAAIFVFNRPAPSADLRPQWGRPWLLWLRLPVKALFIGHLVWSNASQVWQHYRQQATLPPPSLLHGLWEVVAQVEKGRARPPLVTDAARWRYLAVGDAEGLVFVGMDGIKQYCKASDDQVKRKVAIKRWSGGEGEFTYRPTDDGLVLEGAWKKTPMRLELRPVGGAKLLLNNRGFHWVNEMPFNR